MEYIFDIESNEPKVVAYAIPVYEPGTFKEPEFVESGFGLYKFEKGLEVIKQNGNIVTSIIHSKEQANELVQLLLNNGLPRDQVSSILTFDQE